MYPRFGAGAIISDPESTTMSTTNLSGAEDDASTQDTTEDSGTESTTTETGEHRGEESVSQEKREKRLARDKYRCRTCGREGPEAGGLATLHVHHIERDPDDYDENDLANLTTLCRRCHNWVHQQSSPDDAPVSVTEDDLSVLLPPDIEILRFLADEGPARTGVIADALTADLTLTAVREHLAVLMGLDNMVESRETQIVDQDAETREWGLPEQIKHSRRGHIPSTTQALVSRVEDAQVRRALDRGCDRQEVMDVLDISRRTTFHKEKRACAYEFPLATFRRGGDGGQHPAGSTASDAADDATATPEAETGEQQQLDTVADGAGGSNDESPGSDVSDDRSETPDDSTVTAAELQQAIETLQAAADHVSTE